MASKLLYGAAYYDEYMPYERLDKDIEMLKAAGMNVIRIAESTWATMEPEEGTYDFKHIDRVLHACEENGISVIIGTPTYAVPAWAVKKYPQIMVTTTQGQALYGARQIMDITNSDYLRLAKGAIEALVSHVADKACVIGYQLDNETKHYGTASSNVQERFVIYLKDKFEQDLNRLNDAFGLNYWSNRINTWEEFPDVRGTINGSLGAEYSKFQRRLVDEFLSWQAEIVRKYKKEHQFLTQNFDFEWRGHSYGLQPDVNHFRAAKALTIAGCDIYHPTQDDLTGEEIAFGGDMTRSLKQENYLVLETQAQGQQAWLPYEGQLRLQAFSHLASGANSVMYWHYHSIHNSFETYWKGVLSHDFEENDTYLEAKQIGKEFNALSKKLVNLKKKNNVAILVSNEALTAIKWFRIDTGMAFGNGSKPESFCEYNDVLRQVYNVLFHCNAEVDFVTSEMTERFGDYDLLVVPALYTASEECLSAIDCYVQKGGHLFMTFKSGVADENLKVYHDRLPHQLTDCLGMTYNQMTTPVKTKYSLAGVKLSESEQNVTEFMELLKPTTAKVIASYDHENWKRYAATTQNQYGKGIATYLGCKVSDEALKSLLMMCLKQAGIWNYENEISNQCVIRKGMNEEGKEILYYLNHRNIPVSLKYQGNDAASLLDGKHIENGQELTIDKWGVVILERSF
ncbi:beta-galactosidase [Konateibacter massiliensis]|uniref:beta-galactosidase n=1 Tax=Konateibacter massiliensis TaxID=2002841 RepID=UPI000C152916|nr:beta-galactosidase [Konateibacter massiliensis]